MQGSPYALNNLIQRALISMEVNKRDLEMAALESRIKFMKNSLINLNMKLEEVCQPYDLCFLNSIWLQLGMLVEWGNGVQRRKMELLFVFYAFISFCGEVKFAIILNNVFGNVQFF